MFQVAGRTTDASGAVTAFYTRSSDDYNTLNHGEFDEIDFEVGILICACTSGVEGALEAHKQGCKRAALASPTCVARCLQRT